MFTSAWIIAVVIGVILLILIIVLIILVVYAFRRRSKGGAKSSGSGSGKRKGVTTHVVQTDFNAAFARRGARMDVSTMTKRSIFTPAPEEARKSEDYYKLKREEAEMAERMKKYKKDHPENPEGGSTEQIVKMHFNNGSGSRGH